MLSVRRNGEGYHYWGRCSRQHVVPESVSDLEQSDAVVVSRCVDDLHAFHSCIFVCIDQFE